MTCKFESEGYKNYYRKLHPRHGEKKKGFQPIWHFSLLLFDLSFQMFPCSIESNQEFNESKKRLQVIQ